MAISTKENYRTEFSTLQDMTDAIEEVGSTRLFKNPVCHLPPVGNTDFTSGQGGALPAYNETVDLDKHTGILRGQGISTFLTYNGAGHTVNISESDVWLQDMWVDNDDASDTYDAINITGAEFLLDNVEVDGAGRAAVWIGNPSNPSQEVRRGRMFGCSIQATTSQSSNQMGLYLDTSAQFNIISGNIFNSNPGGSVIDNGFGNMFSCINVANGGVGFDFNANMTVGAGLLAYSTSSDGFRFDGSYSGFAAAVSRGNDDPAALGAHITGSQNNMQLSTSANGADGLKVETGTGNVVTASIFNNGGIGANIRSSLNTFMVSSQNNTGTGVDLIADSSVLIANSYGNTGSQLNCNTAKDYNVIMGHFAKVSGSSDPVFYQGRNSAFFGVVRGGQVRNRGSNNAYFGNFQAGFQSESASNGSVVFGYLAGTRVDGAGSLTKFFNQFGESFRCTSYSANVTLTGLEDRVQINTNSGAVTVTLPTASDVKGKEYRIKNTGSNDMVVSGVTFASGSRAAVFVSDGTNWIDFS